MANIRSQRLTGHSELCRAGGLWPGAVLEVAEANGNSRGVAVVDDPGLTAVTSPQRRQLLVAWRLFRRSAIMASLAGCVILINTPRTVQRQNGISDWAAEILMDESMKQKILALLDSHRIMTIATLRPDGWPQATTVGYVNEGLTLWFLCGVESQKAKNLARDDRVSITIDHDTPDIMLITGLSMAARAYRVTDHTEAEKVLRMLPLKYPDAPPAMAQMKMPAPEDVALFRVVPEIYSVIDYTKGFAHTDLVTC